MQSRLKYPYKEMSELTRILKGGTGPNIYGLFNKFRNASDSFRSLIKHSLFVLEMDHIISNNESKLLQKLVTSEDLIEFKKETLITVLEEIIDRKQSLANMSAWLESSDGSNEIFRLGTATMLVDLALFISPISWTQMLLAESVLFLGASYLLEKNNPNIISNSYSALRTLAVSYTNYSPIVDLLEKDVPNLQELLTARFSGSGLTC